MSGLLMLPHAVRQFRVSHRALYTGEETLAIQNLLMTLQILPRSALPGGNGFCWPWAWVLHAWFLDKIYYIDNLNEIG